MEQVDKIEVGNDGAVIRHKKMSQEWNQHDRRK